MFGQSVFGSTPLGVSFEAGASVDSSGAKGHASGSSGGGGGSDDFTKKASGTLQLVQMPRAGLPPSSGLHLMQTCVLDTSNGVLDCPYPTEGPAPQAAKVRINPAILKLFPQMQQRQATSTYAPAGPAPVAGKPFPWLLVGLGVLVLGGAGYWYYTKQKA